MEIRPRQGKNGGEASLPFCKAAFFNALMGMQSKVVSPPESFHFLPGGLKNTF
jgi:hypothetical protein